MTPEPSDQDPDFEVLEEYLRGLQSGSAADRVALLAGHPELARAVQCLEMLERVAPPSGAATDGTEAEATLAMEPARGLPRDFGAYELLEEIGRGGMGVVYKARQKGLDRVVAVKMILASHLASTEHVRRFHLEAKAAAGLRHPHIVHIHEVGQLHGQHFFAMEYVEGKSLAERFAGGTIDLETGVRLLEKVARAVDHLHSHGVIHRDLKPSNILVDEEGQPYVSDFGLAKVRWPGSDMTATGVIAGTPSYMAPEQAAGHSADVSPATDVYSLGAILYELLTGRPPFREENPLDTLVQVLDVEPTLPRQLNRRAPHGLELICLKCLAKSPADRYASAQALADDLERFMRGEELAVRPPNLPQRIGAWARREPALAWRLGALGLFYLVEMVNLAFGGVSWDFHVKMSILIALWAGVSIGFQQSLKSSRWSLPARFVWGTLDSVLLLAVLLVADGVASPLIVGYPLLIVASSLWFRVRFVFFMTSLSLLSYGILVWDFYFRRTSLQTTFPARIDRHVIVAVGMVVLGMVVAYLVQRVRALSRYYGHNL